MYENLLQYYISFTKTFKTSQVRWGDKHGGYGEHYYDYNHGGHGGDEDGEGSQHNSEYAEYHEETNQKPIIATIDGKLRSKRQLSVPQDVEFINPRAKSLVLEGKAEKHGGNYRKVHEFRGKREQKNPISESLMYIPNQRFAVDDSTENQYQREHF